MGVWAERERRRADAGMRLAPKAYITGLLFLEQPRVIPGHSLRQKAASLTRRSLAASSLAHYITCASRLFIHFTSFQPAPCFFPPSITRAAAAQLNSTRLNSTQLDPPRPRCCPGCTSRRVSSGRELPIIYTSCIRDLNPSVQSPADSCMCRREREKKRGEKSHHNRTS